MDAALKRQRPGGILILLAVTGLVALGGGWSLMFYAAWALAFLPNGRMLITEKPGVMRVLSAAGEVGSVGEAPRGREG